MEVMATAVSVVQQQSWAAVMESMWLANLKMLSGSQKRNATPAQAPGARDRGASWGPFCSPASGTSPPVCPVLWGKGNFTVVSTRNRVYSSIITYSFLHHLP